MRRAVNDKLTGPGGLEQSSVVPRSPLYTPGHLEDVAILACGALKDAAVDQLRRQDVLLLDANHAWPVVLAVCFALPSALSTVVVDDNGRDMGESKDGLQ
jgi:hypothetical protein